MIKWWFVGVRWQCLQLERESVCCVCFLVLAMANQKRYNNDVLVPIAFFMLNKIVGGDNKHLQMSVVYNKASIVIHSVPSEGSTQQLDVLPFQLDLRYQQQSMDLAPCTINGIRMDGTVSVYGPCPLYNKRHKDGWHCICITQLGIK